MEEEIFHIELPSAQKVPIMISIPHVGTYIPEDLKSNFRPEIVNTLDDTDFYVDRLYDFAPKLGITVIKSIYSRYVIDLNRSPNNRPLYADGRNTTSLVPTHDFSNNQIYLHSHLHPTEEEIQRRLTKYYQPYHNVISATLKSLKDQFGTALMIDAHSIRRTLPEISKRSFQDIILGDNAGRSANSDISNIAYNALRESHYTVVRNDPFQGGHITRQYGKPKTGIHALQIEMSKDIYMSSDELSYDESKAQNLKPLLKNLFHSLITKLTG